MKTLLLSALLAAIASVSPAEPTPQEILQKCDEARGNLGGVTWTVSVTAIEGSSTNARSIFVQANDFDVMAETRTPARRKGHRLILVKGNMWFYKPDLSKPVPVSQRQKLMGRAANGDIASTNYAEDYDVLETSDGEHEGEACTVFSLEAKTNRSTYNRIRYWVSKERLLGIKAEYYTASGKKLIKSATMTFDNEIDTPEGKRPFISEMEIADELMSRDRTTLAFSDPVLKPIPHHVFNINLLRK